jgi:nucleoside-diphosphate-sugar epimerase
MILVTGGTGMLGAHLLLDLTKKESKIRALKRKTSNLDNVKKIFSFYEPEIDKFYSKIEWLDIELFDIDGLNNVMDGIDNVYHVASNVSFDPREKYKTINNNVQITSNIVNVALNTGIKKLCHVSSVSALGNADVNGFTSEETYRNPKEVYSGYSISKFRSELEVWRGITEGLNAVIVNPSIILAPGKWTSGSPSIFYNIAKGLKYYTKGVTGFVDVWDVVNAMTQLMDSEINNQRFILNSENLSFKEVFSMIADALEVKKPSIYANPFLLELAWRFEAIRSRIVERTPLVTKDSARSAKKHTHYSSKKIIDTFGFKFTPVKESISRIAEIYRKDMMKK